MKSNPQELEEDEETDSEDEKDTHVFTEDEDVSEELSEGEDDFFEESEFNAGLVDQLYPWKGSKASMYEDVELLTEELK